MTSRQLAHLTVIAGFLILTLASSWVLHISFICTGATIIGIAVSINTCIDTQRRRNRRR